MNRELHINALEREIIRLREGWSRCYEEFDRFLDDIAQTAPSWDGDLTPETVLAYVARLRVEGEQPDA